MRLTKRQLKRIIREEYSRLKSQGLISESVGVGSSGGDPIETIKMYIEELHDRGDSAFTVWSKIAQLDRRANKKRQKNISQHFTVTPIANVIKPDEEQHGFHQEIWKLHERGQFRDYENAINTRLKYFIDEQSRQSLADEISKEFGRLSLGTGHL